VPAICTYLEPARSSPQHHIPLPEDPSYQISRPFPLLTLHQSISSGPRLTPWRSRNIRFYGEELAPRPTPKLEDHPLSAVRDCLFNILAAILHSGGRSSIRNLRTRHAMVTGTRVQHSGYNLMFFWPCIIV
jgi:hypothetical protein